MQALVSVVVPIYNVENYLRECIDSIINQAYRHLEIILVDDGSTDSCGSICDEYVEKDSRIQVIHRVNGGLSAARNSGLDLAKGEYIYFCDSDDYLHTEAIDRFVQVIESESSDCVSCNAYTVYEDGQMETKQAYIRNVAYKSKKTVDFAFKQLICDEFKPCIWLNLYKREFLTANNLRFYEGIVGEDELFTFCFSMTNSTTVYLNEPLYYHRIRSGSIMTSNARYVRRFQDSRVIISEMLRYENSTEKEYKLLFKEVVGRIAKSALFAYRNLSTEEKKQNRKSYDDLCGIIRKHKGFGDFSLLLRLHCYYPAVAYSGVRKKIRRYLWLKKI